MPLPVSFMTRTPTVGPGAAGFTFDGSESERLAEENTLLRSALDVARESVCLLKGDQFIYVNRAQAKMFGYSHPDELIGRSWQEIYGSIEQAYLERYARPALRRTGNWRGATLARRQDGSTFIKSLSLQALPDGHLICIGSDITELDASRERLKTANAELLTRSEQLRQANEQLERAARLKDEFMANMSHELRTPLTAILGMTDVLAEKIHGPLLLGQQRCVEVIAGSSQHLLGLINDILDIAKIDARMLELDMQPVSAASASQAVLEIVRSLAEAKGVELAFLFAPSVGFLRADERRLRQILLNLLGNAVKFTPAKGTVRLTVSAEDAGRSVRFSVTDTGIGIAPEGLVELFQPFKQLHGSDLVRNYEGTGLGLALARRLVELHGGRLTVESTVGQGSCFAAILPLGEMPPHLQPDRVDNGNHADRPPRLEPHQFRVLLVDDHEANLEAHRDYLTAKGWHVTVARSGLEAIALVEPERFDLILMDVQMPGIDGLEAIRRIRSLPHGGPLPIIALTALAMPHDCEKCLAAGANRYISKPVAMAALNIEMHQLLEESHS